MALIPHGRDRTTRLVGGGFGAAHHHDPGGPSQNRLPPHRARERQSGRVVGSVAARKRADRNGSRTLPGSDGVGQRTRHSVAAERAPAQLHQLPIGSGQERATSCLGGGQQPHDHLQALPRTDHRGSSQGVVRDRAGHLTITVYHAMDPDAPSSF